MFTTWQGPGQPSPAPPSQMLGNSAVYVNSRYCTLIQHRSGVYHLTSSLTRRHVPENTPTDIYNLPSSRLSESPCLSLIPGIKSILGRGVDSCGPPMGSAAAVTRPHTSLVLLLCRPDLIWRLGRWRDNNGGDGRQLGGTVVPSTYDVCARWLAGARVGAFAGLNRKEYEGHLLPSWQPYSTHLAGCLNCTQV